MKSIHLKDTMGKVLLSFSLLLGIGIMSSMTAQAQYRNDQGTWQNGQQDRRDRNRDWRRNGRNNGRNGRNDDGYGNYGGSFELRQTALNAGANEGNKAGRKDHSRGARYDFSDEREYQKATKDYSSRLGDRSIYQQYFREAFEHGYADGYNGY
jgi:Ni/Co efflux regulator RcnB